MAAMLVELTREANEESFVIVHQHGGNDVTCKSRISEVGKSDHMAMYQLTFDLHAWGFVKEVVIKLCRIQQDLVTAVLDRLVPPGAL